MSTSLVVGCLDVLLPVISRIINLSLSSGHFSDEWKEAFVTPILEKPCLDTTQLNNLRPVSILHFISKKTQRAVFDQIHIYMSRFALYQPYSPLTVRVTERVLLMVKNAILMYMNSKRITVLVLLDLGETFDTVDHDILLARLKPRIGVNGTAISWFTSYLNNRSQRVSLNCCISDSLRYLMAFHKGRIWPHFCLLFTLVNS